MTDREKAIKEIEILKEDYWDDDGYGHKTNQHDDIVFALDMAIKALKQESILDKIRAEVTAISINEQVDEHTMLIRTGEQVKQMILGIINKYMAESKLQEGEGKEWTSEEAIKMLKSKMDGNTDTSYEWAETVRMAIKALEQKDTTERIEYGADGNPYVLSMTNGKEFEQDPCDDEYIKVPKKALKYRTAGMVAYNAEWLKNHFDTERAVICGEQEPCEDCISRQYLVKKAISWDKHFADGIRYVALTDILNAPPVTPAEKVGKWIPVSERLPDLDDYDGSRVWQKKVLITGYLSFDDTKELFVSEAFAEDVVYNSVHDTVVTAWMPLPETYKASPIGAEGSE